MDAYKAYRTIQQYMASFSAIVISFLVFIADLKTFTYMWSIICRLCLRCSAVDVQLDETQPSWNVSQSLWGLLLLRTNTH